MVERVAAALTSHVEAGWSTLEPDEADALARAAIAAMREPTAEMVSAGDNSPYQCSEGVNVSRIIDVDGIAIMYRAMIDEALK